MPHSLNVKKVFKLAKNRIPTLFLCASWCFLPCWWQRPLQVYLALFSTTELVGFSSVDWFRHFEPNIFRFCPYLQRFQFCPWSLVLLFIPIRMTFLYVLFAMFVWYRPLEPMDWSSAKVVIIFGTSMMDLYMPPFWLV